MFIQRSTITRICNAHHAQQGKIYVGFLMFNTKESNFHSYLESPMVCGLEAGKEYLLNFYLQIADNHLHPIQLFFSNQNYISHTANFLDSIPKINIDEGDLITPKKIKIMLIIRSPK